MTLEILQQDMFKAMKGRNSLRSSVLRVAIAAIKKTAIDKKCKDNITEELVNEVLLKEKKILQEQIDTCPKDRVDTLEELGERLDILNEYVPKLQDDPIFIKNVILSDLAAAGLEPVKANKGTAMKLLMPQFKGRYDMKVVNQVIGEILQ